MKHFILVPFWMLFYNNQLAFSPSKNHSYTWFPPSLSIFLSALLPLRKEWLVKIYCGWDFEARIPLNLMGTEHLNPLGSLKISASITNALLIITRFVHDSSRALTPLLVMWLCIVPLTAPGEGCRAHSSSCHKLCS